MAVHAEVGGGVRKSSSVIATLAFESFASSMALMGFVTLAGPYARVLHLEPWQIGTAVSLSGVAWMLMSRWWGIMSDRYGRRIVLLAAMGGFSFSQVALSIFADQSLQRQLPAIWSFAGLCIGRIFVGGFYAGVPTVAAALIADHLPPGQRAAALAKVGTMSGLGILAGPALAGALGGMDFSLALYFLATVPLVGWFVMMFFLPTGGGTAMSSGAALGMFDSRLRGVGYTMFATSLTIGLIETVIGFFVIDRLGLSPAAGVAAAGAALAAAGLVLIPSQMLVTRLHWSPERYIAVSAVMTAVGLVATCFTTNVPMLIACYAFNAIGIGWLFPAVSALTANSVQSHEQGAAAGTVGIAQGLGSVLGPVGGSAIYSLNPGAPYAVAGVLMLACLFVAAGHGGHSVDERSA